MIELLSFEKSYFGFSRKNPVFTVKDVNFKAETGRITAMLGPNGSGKTTIMKAICGFHYGNEGEIFVSDNENHRINVNEHPEMAMSLIGYVPEKSILPPDMYVYDFLDYCAQVHNLNGEEKDKAISRVIKECSLEKVVSKKIKALSKGYAQRVSFAQGIIHNPPNLILDEPVSGLDPAQIIQMRNLIKKMSETKTVILSTHILQEVLSICDDILIICSGKVVAKGTEKEILKSTGKASLEEAFISLTSTGDIE